MEEDGVSLGKGDKCKMIRGYQAEGNLVAREGMGRKADREDPET